VLIEWDFLLDPGVRRTDEGPLQVLTPIHLRWPRPPRGFGPQNESTISAVRIDIHVRPNASNTLVGGTHDGVLVVRVTEPAERGRASAAALRAVADALGVPPRSVRLIRGSTSRRKTLEVEVPDKVRPLVESRLLLLSSGTADNPDFQAP